MTELVDVILLCGGRGTRFWPITYDRMPKSLYKLNDIELMKYSIDVIDFSLVNNLIFAIDHRADDLKEWINSQQFPCNILLSTQTEPGVFGAVKSAVSLVETDNFIVCNTDEVREGMRMKDLLDDHRRHTKYLATLTTANSDHLYYRRIINADEDGVVLSSEYRSSKYKTRPEIVNEVNAGFAVFNINAVNYFNPSYGIDWNSMLEPLIEARLVRAFNEPNLIYFNVGTVKELKNARQYLSERGQSLSVVKSIDRRRTWQ